MSLAPGIRLGPYEIIGAIGAGGMGEVFRARDTKLNRDVAIKVLPAAFADDPERLARFTREAQTLASLNHPNIATIYGIEEVAGIASAASSDGRLAMTEEGDPRGATVGVGASRALVMELIEGEDLSDLIAQGPISVTEALPIARQIAEALEAAHEQGIVHRDLKPGNIKVTPDGRVKVLDFGLAKAMDPSGASSPNVSHSPTLTHQGTMAGMIIGTAAYMSPEQAKGKPVDKRADIWAFGVVLYEMLTGKRLFRGEDVSDTLAAVLRQEVDFAALPSDTPPSVRRLVARCLDRDLKRRLRDIGEARVLLENPASSLVSDATSAQSPGVASSREAPLRRRALPWVIAAGATLVAILALSGAAGRPPAAQSGDASPGVVRFSLNADSSLREAAGSTHPYAISRDGRTVVFAGRDESGQQLWVRTLADTAPRKLPGTENALNPAISPNGEWVAFVVAGKLIRRTRIDGGSPSTVASVDGLTFALDWMSDDEIVLEVLGTGSGLRRVAATGGTPSPLVPLDAAARETQHRRPLVLEGEGLILYTSTVDRSDTLAAFSIKGRRATRLSIPGKQALGLVDGHLIYSREDGFLMAAPFDSSGPRITGPAMQLGERVFSSGTAGTSVALAANGTLVFVPPSTRLSGLVLGTTEGRRTPLRDWVRAFGTPRFSPDGKRVAAAITEPDGSADLWVSDLGSGEPMRVTQGQGGSLAGWTPDGLSLVYVGATAVFTVSVGGGAPLPLGKVNKALEGLQQIRGLSTTPDARWLVVVSRGEKGQTLLSRVSIPEGRLETIGEEPSTLTTRGDHPRVSPDGRWVAFSDDTDVYVRSMTGSGRAQASDGGGSKPVWSRDGRRIFYSAPAGTIVATLDLGSGVKVLSRTPVPAIPQDDVIVDVAPDGKTLLLQSPVGQRARAVVALNWAQSISRELRKGKGR